MKKSVGMACLAVAVAVPCVALAPSAVHAGSITCKPKNSKTCGTGVSVTAYSGTFQVPVYRTHIILKGQASPATHGARIFAQRSTAPHTPAHGVAFRVFALGHLPQLTLVNHGHLYAYAVAKNTWSMAKAVTRSGIYAAVLR